MIDPENVFQFASIQREDSSAYVEWQVPADLPYFEGHFPNHPVLPAIGLVDGSLQLLAQLESELSLEQWTLVRAKFTGMVVPGTTVEVRAQALGNRSWQVSWTKSSESREPLAQLKFKIAP